MVETLKAPKEDRFQIITEHAGDDFIVDPNYLGIPRSRDCVIVQLTLNEGRTVDQKRAFYKAVATGLHQRLNLRLQDVFISLVEVKKETGRSVTERRNTPRRRSAEHCICARTLRQAVRVDYPMMTMMTVPG